MTSVLIEILMSHMADCFQEQELSDMHQQMIELIIILFKQLLQIPDPGSNQKNSAFHEKEL